MTVAISRVSPTAGKSGTTVFGAVTAILQYGTGNIWWSAVSFCLGNREFCLGTGKRKTGARKQNAGTEGGLGGTASPTSRLAGTLAPPKASLPLGRAVRFCYRGDRADEPGITEVADGIGVATVRDPWGNVIGLIANPHCKLPA